MDKQNKSNQDKTIMRAFVFMAILLILIEYGRNYFTM